MNNECLIQWLKEEKHMGIRSAKDVISRSKRVCKMLNIPEIDVDTMDLLLACDKYCESSMFVKSQLKRTVTLCLEFNDYLGDI